MDYFNKNLVEIDITWECNVGCYNCNRSCGKAPTKDRMTVDQIKKFIQETKDCSLRAIKVIGGEPTLHSDFKEIMGLVYDHGMRIESQITIYSNMYAQESRDLVAELPKNVVRVRTEKTGKINKFQPFNLAPIDEDIQFDYSQGCMCAFHCGILVTRYGYYGCPVLGGIDRVIEFDLGARSWDEMTKEKFKVQCEELCPYCGFNFNFHKDTFVTEEKISESWQEFYKQYNENKPQLTLF